MDQVVAVAREHPVGVAAGGVVAAAVFGLYVFLFPFIAKGEAGSHEDKKVGYFDRIGPSPLTLVFRHVSKGSDAFTYLFLALNIVFHLLGSEIFMQILSLLRYFLPPRFCRAAVFDDETLESPIKHDICVYQYRVVSEKFFFGLLGTIDAPYWTCRQQNFTPFT